MSFLRPDARQAQVPVFVAIGPFMRDAVEDLFRDKRLVRADSVRHASILLVAGSLRDSDRGDIRRLHDQLPHPRATIWWNAAPDVDLDAPSTVDVRSDPASSIMATFHALIDASRESEPDLLPDEPPNPWRGKGDHGQGGEGMMGGNPYGRPMAMTDDDLRDGLALDAYTAPFGPFLPMFPPGLKLSLTLQGDVIQSAEIIRSPFAQIESGVPQADMLRRLARFLRILGLEPYAERSLDLAHAASQGKRIDTATLRKLLRWSGARLTVPAGLGMFDGIDALSRFETLLGGLVDGDRAKMAAREVANQEPRRRLVDLLKGLEWNEAVLVVNSFDTETLIALSPVEEDEGSADETVDGHSRHQEHKREHAAHGGEATSL